MVSSSLSLSLSHAVVVFGYNPVSYSFGENSGSSDVSVSISSGDPGAFQLLAQYQTQDLVTGGAQGKLRTYINPIISLRVNFSCQ